MSTENAKTMDIRQAIEAVQAHLESQWIDEGCDGDTLGCASCQAIVIKRQLNQFASMLPPPPSTDTVG